MGEPHVVRLGTVSSTQDVARALAVGSVVVADHQTSGRGRNDRRWEAPPGTALLASFVLEPSPVLSLAAGVAAADACGPQVRLKWPNDLLLGEAKLGGILVEVSGDKAVCGIGINLTWAPEGGAMLGRSRDELLEELRRQVVFWSGAPTGDVLREWRARSSTIGRRVRIEVSGRVHEGVASDIGPHGELIVDGQAYVAGSVTHLR